MQKFTSFDALCDETDFECNHDFYSLQLRTSHPDYAERSTNLFIEVLTEDSDDQRTCLQVHMLGSDEEYGCGSLEILCNTLKELARKPAMSNENSIYRGIFDYESSDPKAECQIPCEFVLFDTPTDALKYIGELTSKCANF